MTHDPTDIPAELRISLDAVPLVETRAVLAREINQCHAPTVPEDAGAICSATARWVQPARGGTERYVGLAEVVRRGAMGQRSLAWPQHRSSAADAGLSTCVGCAMTLSLAEYVPGTRLPPGARLSASPAPLVTILRVKPATSYPSGWGEAMEPSPPPSPADGSVPWCGTLTGWERPTSIRWNQTPVACGEIQVAQLTSACRLSQIAGLAGMLACARLRPASR
jgi:hypothetical protein